MKKKLLVFALIAIMLLTAGVLAACDGGKGKGHTEIVNFVDYENYYVAKNEGAYNVFTSKGKPVLAEDYDVIQILESSVIKATNNTKVSKYFAMDGKEYNFFVSGLVISKIEVVKETKSVKDDDKLTNYITTPKFIVANYFDEKTERSYQSYYKMDGSLIITNTDKIVGSDDKSELEQVLKYKIDTEITYQNDSTIIDEEKLSFIFKQETYRVNFSEDSLIEESNYNSEITIYDGSLNKIFSKKFTGTLVQVDYEESFTYFALKYIGKKDNNFVDYASIINKKNGAERVFDLGIFESDETKDVATFDDLLVLSDNFPDENSTVGMYIPSQNKYSEIQGISFSRSYFDNFLSISTLKDYDITYNLYDVKTLALLKSDVNSIVVKNQNCVLIDGILYDKNVSPLVEKQLVNDVLNYEVLPNSFDLDTYFYAYFENGTIGYYRNSKLLKTFASGSRLDTRSSGLIKETNSDGTYTYYNALDPTIVYNNPSIRESGDGIPYIVDRNKDNKPTRVDVNILNQLKSFSIPANATNAIEPMIRVYADICTVTIRYRQKDALIDTTEYYVYYVDNFSAENERDFERYNVSEVYKSKVDVVEYTAQVDNSSRNIAIYETISTVVDQHSIENIYRTIIFDKKYVDECRKFNTDLICNIDEKNITVTDDYLIQQNKIIGSNFDSVYSKSGKLLTSGEMTILSIIDGYAKYTKNGNSYGIIKFTEDGYKIIEDAKYDEVQLLPNGYYMVSTYDKNHIQLATLKDSKGKVIIDKAYDIEYSQLNNPTVIDGKIEFNLAYQLKPDGKYYYKCLGKMLLPNM